MCTRSLAIDAITLLASVVCVACHPAAQTPSVAAAPARTADGYCWWAVYRSPLPADTVVARYARAFEHVGLSDVTSSRAGDTVWAHAGPTMLGGDHANGTYSARIVAVQHGDSAHFRTYVRLVPPAGGWPDSASGAARGVNVAVGRHLRFCGELGRSAGAHGAATSGPGAEEKLEVWQRY